MKRIITALLVLAFALSLPAVAFAADESFDSGAKTAYPQAIAAGLRLGIIGYMSGEEYRPLDAVSRAEFAQMLYNAFAENPLKATDATAWWKPAVDWLYTNAVQRDLTAVFYGGQDGAFHPDDSASVEFMLEMLYLTACAHGQMNSDESVHTAACSWADRYGIGPGSDNLNWRFLSHGDYVARAEAIALIAGLLDRTAPD